jgi:hypothetical protein
LLPGLQAAAHHQLIVDLLAELQLDRPVATGILSHIGQRAPAGADHRLAGHKQQLLRRGLKPNRQAHAFAQAQPGIRQLQAHAQGPGLGAGLRQDGADLGAARCGLAGQQQLGRLADTQQRALSLRHRGLHPDCAQAVDASQAHAGGHRHAGPDHQLGEQAGARQAYRGAGLHGAALLHLRNHRVGHAQQPQPLAGRLAQGLVLQRLHRQVFALRALPLGQQQLDQRRARGHHIAGRQRVDALDEAAGACLHDADVALAELHRAQHLDAARDAALLHRGQPQAQRLLRLR